MCFAMHSCDTFLITAHISSYSFWIGYLLPPTSDIYYIASFIGLLGHESFPPEWTALFDNNVRPR